MKVVKSTSICLQSGMLLSKEILEQMNAQSRLFQLQYTDYPDGILYGLEPFEKNGILYLSTGMLKYQGKYFFLESPMNLFDILDEFDEKGKMGFTEYRGFAFVPSEQENVHEGISSDCLQLELCEKKDLNSDNIVIAEFQYHNSKRIWKSKNQSAVEKLEDQLNTEGYYYSFLHTMYSMPHENVFSPYIYQLMKECLSQKKHRSSADLMLLFTLCQNRLVSFEVLKEWFDFYKIQVNFSDRKNIINNFLKALKKEAVEKSTMTKKTVQQNKPKKKFNDDFGI